MLLAKLAAVSEAVSVTSSRTAKRKLLAEVLAELEPEEVEAAVGFLVGAPRQGALGVGWATVAKVTAEPAVEASITVAELDATLSELQRTEGQGSNQTRQGLLAALWERGTAAEHDFIGRLLTGGLRQGALAGVVSDAVAAAAGVPATAMRRATMLQGDLGQAAAVALTEGIEGLATIDLVVGRPIQPMLASTAADELG
ncbi:MAG: ATP-dependent DNA ligase, partial [Actinomycetota bacterium]